MSAQAPIAPTTVIGPQRASVGRMVVVAFAYMAIVIAGAVYPLVSPLRDFMFVPPTALRQAVDAIVLTTWLAVLLASMARQPSGRLWKLIFLYLVATEINALEFVPDSLVWSVERVVDLFALALFIQLLLAFPSGYLHDRFDRAVVVFAYALVSAWSLDQLLLSGESAFACNPSCIRNVFVIWPNPELYDWLRNAITVIGIAGLFPLVLVGLVRHWRQAGAAGRRALLPLVVGVPLLLVSAGADVGSHELDFQPGANFFDSPSGLVIRLIVPAIVPLGLLLGILRARWSQGRIAGLVVELGRGVPVGGLRDVLARALGDPTLELAFAGPSGLGFVDAHGLPVELPVADGSRTVTRLERDGELVGVLVHDPEVESEAPGLVEVVGNAARLALENERLAAEVRAQLEDVRASRARVVEAADAERRRVERDLHDGAQQRLVALAMRLQVAKESTPGASDLLDEATAELQTAIGEVRGLARGIHPTILTEAGLRAAVDALAERTPVAVTVDIPDRRYDPQLEATAYFVVAEALTNIARYAGATEARVSALEDDGRLVVTIVDDGIGGADPAAGSGLRGLADRLAALDGRLGITSPSGGGTSIRAELPLAAVERGRANDAQPAATPSALAMVRAVPQEREAPRRQRRVRLSDPVVLILVAAVSMVVIAMVAALPGVRDMTPVDGRADTFVRPFVYELPVDSGIRLDARSARLHVLSGRQGGISIWAVKDVLVDHCSWDPTTPVASRQPGVEGLLAYLRSVDRLHVQEIGPLLIDGRPAYRVDLTVEGHDSGCEDHAILLWRDQSADGNGGIIQVPEGGRVPVTILQVYGETIAIEIWNGDEVGPWEPTAERIVESIGFLYRPPAESPAASPLAP
jgi:signal transduction histidine kinase